ncbi:hypothetical protein G5C51_28555 [Streptomyces sp. A7024]|uniref:Uncharacterized protein n=1 Tax=Streptomyces coryli TaxID=1128680 RepID=A0A6G4U7Y3_9ACTN|nr:hypothetical protein [Streptomyces coryli]NGN67840.1 hypothetical protein [Streptomyces coryli]
MDDAPRPAWTRTAERANLAVLAVAAVATAVLLFLYLRGDNSQPLKGWALLAVAIAVLLTSVIIAVVRPFLLTRGRTMAASALVSLVLAGGIITTWMLVSGDDADALSAGQVVNTRAEADAYLDKEIGTGQDRVPTGLLVQQADYDGPSKVKASGYVWQRLPKEVPEKSEGVIFPEAEDSHATTEIYRKQHPDGSRTVGWYFQATLHQTFDYRRYPLDRQDIHFAMWSNRFTQGNLVLVPDFASYPPWKAEEKLGVDPETHLQGWKTTFTTWSYQKLDYRTNMGATTGEYQAGEGRPNLNFNLGVARQWHNPLIDSLIRSAIVSLMIFLSLFLFARADDERRSSLGFSTWGAVTFGVSMLLVIVVDQSSVRQVTGSSGMAYLEYFAFAQYAVILWVAIDAVLLGRRRSPSLEWGDNRLAKLLYWPLLLTLIFAATLWVFRPRW